MLKNKICILILALSLTLPVLSVQEESDIVQEATKTETIEETAKEDTNVSAPQAEETLMSDRLKQPVSKKKIAKKFLLAMFGVAASSFIIYFGLTVYNKFRDGVDVSDSSINSENDQSLETPENLSEAVKTFIEKTKWE